MMKTPRTGSWTPFAALVVATLAGCAAPDTDGVALAGAAASREATGDPHHHAAHHHDATGDQDMPVGAPADFSIYHAESVWTDQHSDRRPIGSLAGRVQVVGMVYTSCAYACPRMVLDMKRIEEEFPGRDDVGFVLVSIDPDRDTPERLAEFARGARLDPSRWTLLHGEEGDVLELAALLGVQYRRMANDEFIHSNLLTVLDRGGQVVHRQLGLGADPRSTVEVIRALDA
jgi:protein SCO1